MNDPQHTPPPTGEPLTGDALPGAPVPGDPLTGDRLPALVDQAEALIEYGIHDLAQITPEQVRSFAADHHPAGQGSLLAVHPAQVPASRLAPLMHCEGKPGFIVGDMTDVDSFEPVDIELPDTVLYLVRDPQRGEDMVNWSPEEALPAIASRERTPLLLSEGLHWVLQQPGILERNLCFMTIGSRLKKPSGAYDSRTPALWISNGTGRDGRERKNAPKVGWCWWRNRHTWLGIASAAGRTSHAMA